MSVKSTIDDLRKYRSLVLVIFIFCMVSTLSFLAARSMQHSSAASLSGFKPGNIISDAVMGNYNAMTKDEIQAFLTRKNPCNNRNYSQYQSLKQQYPHLDWHFENGHFVCLSEERFGDGVEIGQGQTAAEIIYQAAQDYRINPQVLLVLLEKEQSLISDTYPNTRQYRSATGYGCPDTAACNTKYYGFKNQVRNAAALFRNVLDHGYSAYPEQKKGVYIGYNPNSSCGRSEVYIENRATAALYRYTPYQPNAAALAAGYGAGDGCSAYGNRNFYLYFTDWFGSTQVAVDGEQVVIPDGEYSFVSQLSQQASLAVDAHTGNTQISTSDTRQKWQVKRDASTGYYSIKNTQTGKMLDVDSASTVPGTNIKTWAANDSCAQKWRIYRTPDNALTFESACATGMVLDIYNESVQDKANIQLWLSKGGNHQKWQIYTGRTVADGFYYLRSALSGNKDAEIYGDARDNGANVSLWDHLERENRKWQLIYDGSTDYYSFINPVSGKALDVFGGTASNGANVSIYERNNTCAQKWKIIPQENGNYQILTACSIGYSLDVYGANTHNTANIQIWSTHSNVSEQWKLEPVRQIISNGTYNIIAQASGTSAVDVFDAKTNDGANVSIWDINGHESEKWQITYNVKSDDYTIINPVSNKALDVYGANTQRGTNIQIWQPNKSCSQRWRIVQSNESYQLLSVCDTSKALDLWDAQTTNGTNIQLWDKNNTAAQKWILRKI